MEFICGEYFGIGISFESQPIKSPGCMLNISENAIILDSCKSISPFSILEIMLLSAYPILFANSDCDICISFLFFLLKAKIKESGIPITFIAKKSGMSRETLYNRLKGKGEFNASETLLLRQRNHKGKIGIDSRVTGWYNEFKNGNVVL